MLVTDACNVLHLLVRGITAKIRRDDCVIAEHLRDQRIGAAAESGRENGAIRIDHEHVRLALMSPQLIDLLLEVGSIGCEQVMRNIKALPPRIVPIESALEVAGDRGEAPFATRSHSD